MEEVRLNMLMMGKTGNGKSAAANMILNRKVFKTDSKATSVTKFVSYNFAIFNNYNLLVVDGPGLEDTEQTPATDKEEAAKNMNKALAMCYGGVDAFLFVYRFGNRMTREERAALDALKQIFGNTFMNHVIVVVTYGDQFCIDMEDEERNISFPDWCREQTGEFRQLCEDCDGRIVLFNNTETDVVKKREQVQQIVQLTHDLQTKSGRYTSLCFELAERERRILLLVHEAPHLKREFQEKMCILMGEIDNLSANSSNTKKERVKKRIMDLKYEIKRQDNGCSVFRDLLSLIENMESSLNDVEQLMYLNKKLEEIRLAKAIWNVIGPVCCFVRGVFRLFRPAEKSNDDRLDKDLLDLSIEEGITEQQMEEIEKERIKLITKQTAQKGGQKEGVS